MNRPQIKEHHRPEHKIQVAIQALLRLRGWYVKQTVGNAYTSGWPDLFCCHKIYGHRWIEVKLPDMKGSKFTNAQLRDFPLFTANGSGIWVLTAATELEYAKLFTAPNWWQYTTMWK